MKKTESYVILYLAFFIYSVSSICAKIASQQSVFFRVMIFLVLEVGCLGLYAVIWQQVLKRFSLITAMASKGVVVIFNLIWSVMLFNEHITIYNCIGAIIIMTGIWIVSGDQQ